MKIISRRHRSFSCWRTQRVRRMAVPLWDHGPVPERGPRGVGVNRRYDMSWSKPTYSEIRWGFEITMYVATR